MEKVQNVEIVNLYGIRFSRVWAMPDRFTFAILPIMDLLARYCPRPNEWVDPFAGWNSPARYRNDLNPEAPVEYHEDARNFIRRFDKIQGFLFDPPYSPRQISECYKELGMPVTMEDTQNATWYGGIKDEVSIRMVPGSLALCFGWNSTGFGTGRGFELLEILLVCHGGAHNDTIVTVEKKQTLF